MVNTIWLGKIIAQLDDEQPSVLRCEYFGFIFQRYHLLPYLTAEQNVEFLAIYAGTCQQERRKRAIGLLARISLSDRIKYYPTQLSGGQQQRVSIARKLINGGQIILADEPVGHWIAMLLMKLLLFLNSYANRDILLFWLPIICGSQCRQSG